MLIMDREEKILMFCLYALAVTVTIWCLVFCAYAIKLLIGI